MEVYHESSPGSVRSFTGLPSAFTEASSTLSCSSPRVRFALVKVAGRCHLWASPDNEAALIVVPPCKQGFMLAGEMRFNSDVTLDELLTAIPSALIVCNAFRMTVRGNGEKMLDELCSEHGITFELFLHALDDLDWNEDYHSQRPN